MAAPVTDGRAFEAYHGPALPPDLDAMESIIVGKLRVGATYRRVTEELAAQIDGPLPRVGSLNDEGVSFHIFDDATGTEHLRFDCFAEDPHYHYLAVDRGVIFNVGFDRVANGPMRQWVIGVLASNLAEMLRLAGAEHLAVDCDGTAVARAVEELAARIDRGKTKWLSETKQDH